MRSHKSIDASAWNVQSLKALSPPLGGTRDMFVHHQKSVSVDAQDPRCALMSHEALHHEHSGLQSARATCCTHPEVRDHKGTEPQVT